MTKILVMANGIILFYILQRITEMLISKDNERWLKENCHAVEVDPSEAIKMKIFHSLWFISLLIETNIKKDIYDGITALFIYLILAICMGVRVYSVDKLKRFWTIKVFSLENQILVTDGLYKYIRHPNYLVVILEFIFLPLLFKAYLTMVVFSFINLFVLSKRINLEEVTLMNQTNYSEKFKGVKRLVPYFLFFGLFILNPVNAKELNYQYKNYEAAKKAEDFILFEGSSTKLGLITTGFDGYAKEYKVSYDLVNDQVNKLGVIIPVSALDTDVESRNEKMINTILNREKFPEIQVRIIDKVILTNGEQTLNMMFTVKDLKVIRPVVINVEKLKGQYYVTGKSTVGIKELGLPDPSIVIAKVKDELNLKFSIHLQE